MPTKLRVVLDTNVIISGLISPKGPPAGILKALKAGRFILVTSQAINEEVLEVMDRPRLRDKYGLAHYLVTGDIKDLRSLGEYKGTRIVSPEQFLSILHP